MKSLFTVLIFFAAIDINANLMLQKTHLQFPNKFILQNKTNKEFNFTFFKNPKNAKNNLNKLSPFQTIEVKSKFDAKIYLVMSSKAQNYIESIEISKPVVIRVVDQPEPIKE